MKKKKRRRKKNPVEYHVIFEDEEEFLDYVSARLFEKALELNGKRKQDYIV